MKKLLIAVVLIAGITAIAFASFASRKSKKQTIEKKTENKEKQCRHACPYSS